MMDDTPTAEETPAPLDDPKFVAALDDELGQHLAELTPPNRATRRAKKRGLRRRLVLRDAGIKRLSHPLFTGADQKPALTLWGAKELRRRRLRAKAARLSRRTNRGV